MKKCLNTILFVVVIGICGVRAAGASQNDNYESMMASSVPFRVSEEALKQAYYDLKDKLTADQKKEFLSEQEPWLRQRDVTALNISKSLNIPLGDAYSVVTNERLKVLEGKYGIDISVNDGVVNERDARALLKLCYDKLSRGELDDDDLNKIKKYLDKVQLYKTDATQHNPAEYGKYGSLENELRLILQRAGQVHQGSQVVSVIKETRNKLNNLKMNQENIPALEEMCSKVEQYNPDLTTEESRREYNDLRGACADVRDRIKTVKYQIKCARFMPKNNLSEEVLNTAVLTGPPGLRVKDVMCSANAGHDFESFDAPGVFSETFSLKLNKGTLLFELVKIDPVNGLKHPVDADVPGATICLMLSEMQKDGKTEKIERVEDAFNIMSQLIEHWAGYAEVK